MQQSELHGDAARLDQTYRRILRPSVERPELQPEPERPTYKLSELRQIGQHLITWVDKVVTMDGKQVFRTARSVPWWVWAILAVAYGVSTGLRLRSRRVPGVQQLSVLSMSPGSPEHVNVR